MANPFDIYPQVTLEKYPFLKENKYFEYTINLTPSQIKNFGKNIIITLDYTTNKEPYKVFLTNTQIKKVEAAKKLNRKVDLKFSKTQFKKTLPYVTGLNRSKIKQQNKDRLDILKKINVKKEKQLNDLKLQYLKTLKKENAKKEKQLKDLEPQNLLKSLKKKNYKKAKQLNKLKLQNKLETLKKENAKKEKQLKDLEPQNQLKTLITRNAKKAKQLKDLKLQNQLETLKSKNAKKEKQLKDLKLDFFIKNTLKKYKEPKPKKKSI